MQPSQKFHTPTIVEKKIHVAFRHTCNFGKSAEWLQHVQDKLNMFKLTCTLHVLHAIWSRVLRSLTCEIIDLAVGFPI